MAFHKQTCECDFCSSLPEEEREALRARWRAIQVKGGKKASTLPHMTLARIKGGVRTYNDAIMSGDPVRIARVKNFCRDHNVAKASALGVTPATARKEAVARTRELMANGIVRRDNA